MGLLSLPANNPASAAGPRGWSEDYFIRSCHKAFSYWYLSTSPPKSSTASWSLSEHRWPFWQFACNFQCPQPGHAACPRQSSVLLDPPGVRFLGVRRLFPRCQFFIRCFPHRLHSVHFFVVDLGVRAPFEAIVLRQRSLWLHHPVLYQYNWPRTLPVQSYRSWDSYQTRRNLKQPSYRLKAHTRDHLMVTGTAWWPIRSPPSRNTLSGNPAPDHLHT